MRTAAARCAAEALVCRYGRRSGGRNRRVAVAAGTGVAVGTGACRTEARQSVRTYVITAWLPRNPDGAPVLLRVCGRNAVAKD